MVEVIAGGVPVKGASLLPTMRLSPGVQTPEKQAHHGSPSQHSAALAPAQCYSPAHSPEVNCGKRPSAPSQSYRRGGGRAAAADPHWYRSRCHYRCTAAGTAGHHSRCRRCDRWLELQGISSGAMTRFRATENVGKRTTEIPFILVAPVLSRKGDTISSVACLLYSSMVANTRCSRRPW